MNNKELLRALIAEIDLIMHDKAYRFPESENTWYSRESCKVLTPEEVFEELRTELLQLNHETNSKIAELQKQLQEWQDGTIIYKWTNAENKVKKLQKQLEEKEKEIKTYKQREYILMEQLSFNVARLERQLKSQPAEIVEKIKEQLYSKVRSITGTGVNCVRLYDIRQILDVILKQYQK